MQAQWSAMEFYLESRKVLEPPSKPRVSKLYSADPGDFVVTRSWPYGKRPWVWSGACHCGWSNISKNWATVRDRLISHAYLTHEMWAK